MGRGWRFFAYPDTNPSPARCQNQEVHFPLAINTAACERALFILVAGLALCYREINNLTWLDHNTYLQLAVFLLQSSIKSNGIHKWDQWSDFTDNSRQTMVKKNY